MKIIPLSEGTFTIDRTKMFVPFDEEQHELHERPRGSLLVEVQPFAVITRKDILLLDTGLGFEQDGVLQIHRNLRAAGIEPSAVTRVLLTHLHKDHAGGATFGPDHHWMSFPNATYHLQEAELSEAFATGSPSFITEELEVLRASPQVELLKEPEGNIDGYITYRHTGAHSRHHQVFWIKEDGQTIFFGGDDAPQL
ncbi:MAG TPA: MBL fold metallo-hydrolase, partial [Flavisolibacter sp.]